MCVCVFLKGAGDRDSCFLIFFFYLFNFRLCAIFMPPGLFLVIAGATLVVCRLLTVGTSLGAEHRLQAVQASVAATQSCDLALKRRLNSSGTRGYWLCG